jgi:ABC-2 type transport system permease protein
MKPWWAQTRAEIEMTLRRGETLLLTIGIPVLLLVFFSISKVTTSPTPHRVDFIAPGVLALCIMSTSLVALSISTGFERSYGVLRRLHVTPLGTRRLIGAKIAGVLVTEVIQVTVLSIVALLLKWHPRGGFSGGFEVTALMILGSAGFAGIGLLLAGRLKAEVNLAASNGLYLILLLVSGIVVPIDSMPQFIQHLVVATPSGALAEGLHRVLGLGLQPTVGDWISVSLWALLAPLLAVRTFRFD